MNNATVATTNGPEKEALVAIPPKGNLATAFSALKAVSKDAESTPSRSFTDALKTAQPPTGKTLIEHSTSKTPEDPEAEATIGFDDPETAKIHAESAATLENGKGKTIYNQPEIERERKEEALMALTREALEIIIAKKVENNEALDTEFQPTVDIAKEMKENQKFLPSSLMMMPSLNPKSSGSWHGATEIKKEKVLARK